MLIYIMPINLRIENNFLNSHLNLNYMKKIVLSVFAILLLSVSLIAQDQRVSGTVTGDDGAAIAGVTVIIKGTSHGTITDSNGKYSMVVSKDGTLIFSFMGMKSQEIPVASKTIVNAKLLSDALGIDDVVVTASGMTRAEKTLGYASTTIKADDIAAGKSTSVMSGLAGKVAGMNISTAGGTGTSQKVIVRGYSSLTGGNQPLYVVDGVPVGNTFSGIADLSNSADFGNQAGDINPDDVESVTVLKGASATALYGSRASNGVIMITTKKSSLNQAIKVTYDATFMGSDVLRVPQTQKMFGQGWDYSYGFTDAPLGSWSGTENGSWGPRLDGRNYGWALGAHEADGMPLLTKPFSYAEDSKRHFYDMGFEAINNISISGGGQNTSYMITYGNTYSNGILPGNDDYYKRNTFSFRGHTQSTNTKFTMDYDVTYVRKDIQNAMTGQGSDGATIFGDILQHPTDIDYGDLKDYNNVYNNFDNYYTPYAINPWWIVDKNKATYQDDRVYGKIELGYKLAKGLKAIARLGGDFTNSREKYMNEKISRTPGSYNSADWMGGNDELGSYGEYSRSWNQIDASALLVGDYTFGDFSLNATAGWNLNQSTSSWIGANFTSLKVPGWFSYKNSDRDIPTESETSRRRLIGLLAQADLGYKNFAYLTLSARNDWSSTLPIDDNSFFYWGANGSLLMTEMLPSIKSKTLNFLKVRLAYGQTGNDALAYLTGLPYYSKPKYRIGFGTSTPPNGLPAGLGRDNTIPSTSLRPEISTETEVGIDLRMFNNRLSIDASYYYRVTKDQIMPIDLSPEIGYTEKTANVGRIDNQGVELMVSVVPIRKRDFEWELTWTYAKNKSEVKELWGDVTSYNIYGLTSTPGLYAVVGQPLGVFMDTAIKRVTEDGPDKGKIIVNDQGFPSLNNDSQDIIGYSAPDFTMGLNSKMAYKNLSFSFLFDWRKGGSMYSNTKAIMHFVGTAPETAYNERNPFIVPNSVREVNGKYVENNIPADMLNRQYDNYYYDNLNPAMGRNYLVDKSCLKLREVNVTYTMPKKWFENSFISSLQVSLIGRNLFMWTPDGQNYIDPEMTNYGNDIQSEWGEFSAAPSTRNFGGSIRVIF